MGVGVGVGGGVGGIGVGAGVGVGLGVGIGVGRGLAAWAAGAMTAIDAPMTSPAETLKILFMFMIGDGSGLFPDEERRMEGF